MRQKVASLIPEHGSLFETSTPVGVWGGHRSTATKLDVDLIACGLNRTEFEIEGGLSNRYPGRWDTAQLTRALMQFRNTTRTAYRQMFQV